MNASVNYRAYLLRLWRVAGAQWRASLEDPRTGERRAFGTLEQLWEYLTQTPQPGSGGAETERPAPSDEARVD